MMPIRKMLVKSGITEQQWRVLRVLSERGPQDAKEVSERACLLAPSLTRIIRTMTEKNLITRTQNPNDRRRQTLEITEAGQKIIENNRLEGMRIVDGFKARAGEDKYEQLLDLLEEFYVPIKRIE